LHNKFQPVYYNTVLCWPGDGNITLLDHNMEIPENVLKEPRANDEITFLWHFNNALLNFTVSIFHFYLELHYIWRS